MSCPAHNACSSASSTRSVCNETDLESGAVNASVLQNEVRRLIEPVRPKALNTGDALQLTTEPLADFQRYDHLLEIRHVH